MAGRVRQARVTEVLLEPAIGVCRSGIGLDAERDARHAEIAADDELAVAVGQVAVPGSDLLICDRSSFRGVSLIRQQG